MFKKFFSVISAVFALTQNCCFAQGIFESVNVNAGAAGVGAGVAASVKHGKAVVQTQQAIVAQTQAINQYMKLGAQYESKKQWENAEKSFRYVLQVSALRDGPGSEKTLPALKHLVTICQAQNNLGEAVGFQKRVLGLTEAQHIPSATFDARINLCNLFMEKEQYVEAEPLLAKSVEETTDSKTVAPEKRNAALKTYAKVLRKLNKDGKAKEIEASITEDKTIPAEAPSGSSAGTQTAK